MSRPEDNQGIPSDDEIDKLADELGMRRLLKEAAEHFELNQESILRKINEGG